MIWVSLYWSPFKMHTGFSSVRSFKFVQKNNMANYFLLYMFKIFIQRKWALVQVNNSNEDKYSVLAVLQFINKLTHTSDLRQP